jgi:hypothetical protein
LCFDKIETSDGTLPLGACPHDRGWSVFSWLTGEVGQLHVEITFPHGRPSVLLLNLECDDLVDNVLGLFGLRSDTIKPLLTRLPRDILTTEEEKKGSLFKLFWKMQSVLPW